jgi:dihydroorotate dehydrogenase
MLAQTLWDRDFPNPVGLAAGFDKNAEVPNAMLAFGFGFVEIGSVTPKPQPGNPRPRLFRLAEDGAVINRMGFNNDGMVRVAQRLSNRRKSGLVGVNLGRNKETADPIGDYEKGVAALGPYADYLVVNVSSPNTPGLRALQGRGPLEELVGRVRLALDKLTAPPALLLKIAPDLESAELRDIATVALNGGLAGLIVSNTTTERPASLRSHFAGETGGLSGLPLFEQSTRILHTMYALTEGKLPLIGVGGIASAEHAYAKIRAGASLVQLYSALVYQGPALVGRIKQGLTTLLRRDGFANVTDAVGADH